MRSSGARPDHRRPRARPAAGPSRRCCRWSSEGASRPARAYRVIQASSTGSPSPGMVSADGEELQALGPGLEGPRRRGRDADGVQRADVAELVVELDPAAPAQDDVDLLGGGVAVGERAALPGPQAEEGHPGALGAQRGARDPGLPAVAEAVPRGRVVDRVQADLREGVGHAAGLPGPAAQVTPGRRRGGAGRGPRPAGLHASDPGPVAARGSGRGVARPRHEGGRHVPQVQRAARARDGRGRPRAVPRSATARARP